MSHLQNTLLSRLLPLNVSLSLSVTTARVTLYESFKNNFIFKKFSKFSI